MKKCDEQAINRDEQARGVKKEGKMRADFLDRRTGFSESERSGERLLQAARRVSAANQFTGVGGKAFGLNSSLPWDERLNSILLILSKNPFKMGHSSAAR